MIYIIILFTFFLLSCFYNFNHDVICFLCLFFLIKWILDYRKCTVSYIECKLRCVKKEEGIVYNIMEEIYDINKSKYKYIAYSFVIIVFFINYKKLKTIK